MGTGCGHSGCPGGGGGGLLASGGRSRAAVLHPGRHGTNLTTDDRGAQSQAETARLRPQSPGVWCWLVPDRPLKNVGTKHEGQPCLHRADRAFQTAEQDRVGPRAEARQACSGSCEAAGEGAEEGRASAGEMLKATGCWERARLLLHVLCKPCFGSEGGSEMCAWGLIAQPGAVGSTALEGRRAEGHHSGSGCKGLGSREIRRGSSEGRVVRFGIPCGGQSPMHWTQDERKEFMWPENHHPALKESDVCRV